MQQTRPHPEWKILIEKTRDLDWGSVITYDQIQNWTGIPTEHAVWRSMIGSWKRHMEREFNKILVPIYGEKRYRILLPKETESHAVNFVRLAQRRLRRGIRTIIHAPIQKMTEAETLGLRNTSVRMGLAAAMLKEQHRAMLPPPAPALSDGSASTPRPRVLR